MATFAERLVLLRNKEGLSQAELGESVGLEQSEISRLERAKRPASLEIISKFAEFFHVSLDYMAGRDVPSKANLTYQQALQNLRDVATVEEVRELLESIGQETYTTGPMVAIPVLGYIRAGAPIIAEENRIGYEEVPADLVKGGQYFMLQVEGDSMLGDGILPGSHVLVRMQQELEPDSIGVVIVDSENGTVKHVRQADGHIVLYGSNIGNPDAMPRLLNPDDIRIIGEVVKIITDPKRQR